jgi:hypothetical protein
MKTNMISVISVRIRSVFIPTCSGTGKIKTKKPKQTLIFFDKSGKGGKRKGRETETRMTMMMKERKILSMSSKKKT